MIAVIAVLLAAQPASKLDTAKIEQLTGLKGKLDEKEGAFKVSYPRDDIGATAAGVKLTPPLGLTAWAAFSGGGAHTMVMGDVVLTEDQVNTAMGAALIAGFTWSSVRTTSPITMVCAPPPLKAAQAVRPSGGVSFTPAAVEPISLRGYETLNVPSFSSSLPLSPVSCSIFAVSNLAAGCAASNTAMTAIMHFSSGRFGNAG